MSPHYRPSALARSATFALLSVAVVACTHVDKNDKSADCLSPPGVTSVAIPDGIARPVRIAAAGLTGDTIPLDFDAPDAPDNVEADRIWRFVLAWRAGIRWIIATQRKGDARYFLFVFDLQENARIPTVIQGGAVNPETLCQEGEEALTAYPLPGTF
jgi:hypothetical protein